jgi:hypothetical protein
MDELTTKGKLTWEVINDPEKVWLVDPIAFFTDSFSVIDPVALGH